MEIIKIDSSYADMIAPLVAGFRVALRSCKGVKATPDVKAAKEELLDFFNSGYPVFAAKESGELAGYIVCRTDPPCLWVEHLFVRSEYRLRGIASALFEKAEELAKAMGEDTVFNYVHPNNEGMIGFLRSKGYTVLNMIEIRKPYEGENLTAKIKVDGNVFDY